jgi:ketosteroid isomerase-like protein
MNANNTNDQVNIQQMIDLYEVALNSSNTAAAMELYSQSPVFMPQHAPAQKGRNAVKAAYDSVFDTIKLNVKFTIHEIEVNGDTAWMRTSSDGQTQILAPDVVVTEGNNELFVFKKEDGSWKIHRYLFSTNQPRA